MIESLLRLRMVFDELQVRSTSLVEALERSKRSHAQSVKVLDEAERANLAEMAKVAEEKERVSQQTALIVAEQVALEEQFYLFGQEAEERETEGELREAVEQLIVLDADIAEFEAELEAMRKQRSALTARVAEREARLTELHLGREATESTLHQLEMLQDEERHLAAELEKLKKLEERLRVAAVDFEEQRLVLEQKQEGELAKLVRDLYMLSSEFVGAATAAFVEALDQSSKSLEKAGEWAKSAGYAATGVGNGRQWETERLAEIEAFLSRHKESSSYRTLQAKLEQVKCKLNERMGIPENGYEQVDQERRATVTLIRIEDREGMGQEWALPVKAKGAGTWGDKLTEVLRQGLAEAAECRLEPSAEGNWKGFRVVRAAPESYCPEVETESIAAAIREALLQTAELQSTQLTVVVLQEVADWLREDNRLRKLTDSVHELLAIVEQPAGEERAEQEQKDAAVAGARESEVKGTVKPVLPSGIDRGWFSEEDVVSWERKMETVEGSRWNKQGRRLRTLLLRLSGRGYVGSMGVQADELWRPLPAPHGAAMHGGIEALLERGLLIQLREPDEVTINPAMLSEVQDLVNREMTDFWEAVTSRVES